MGACSGLPGANRPGNEVPPDVQARRFGRWICGSELPQGRPSSSFELLRHLGPRKAWDLEVDADGLAALQVVGHHGRARQGCWTEMTLAEMTTLETLVRDNAICERLEDPRATEPHNAFDVDLHLASATCTKHFGATALLRAPQGQKFANGTQHVLDQIAGGSFRRMEEIVTSMVPAPERARGRTLPANVAAVSGRLTCAKDRPTIYEAGDPWLLQYSFQKGFLWRRDLEVSARGALSLAFASLQNEAKYSCTGQLTDGELKRLRDVLDSSHPCDLTGPPPRGRDDHAYVSVNSGADSSKVDCRYHALRQEDLRDGFKGRRFDGFMTDLVSQLAGEGGVDPFDAERGVLVEKKAAPHGRKTASKDDHPTRAPAVVSDRSASATFQR
ncbi:MAG TPA: hypothetical protein VGP07_20730 [Polyangia bacterium]